MRTLLALVLLGWVGAACSLAQGIDLASKYPAKLDASKTPRGHEWTCDSSDVWSLNAFSYKLGEQLELTLGPSIVVFGKHDTSVLWAAVIPDQPGKLKAPGAGNGNAVAHVWLRFHPSRVGELFPPETVRGPGPADRRWQGERIAAWKMRGSWQAGGLPMVPTKEAIVLDLDTSKRVRRFFTIDAAANKLEYVARFEPEALPELEKIDRETALKAFDQVWEAFDREYAMFVIKPAVDWSRLRETYRPRASTAKTSYEVAAVVSEMLAHLEDLHAWVRVGGEYVPGYNRPRPLNANWDALKAAVPDLKETKQDLAWGRTADNIGYINVYRLGYGRLAKAFDEVLENLSDTWALIIDLRFNGGGDEMLARKVAGRFLDKKRVYSLNQYRSGPKHSDLGPRLERVCEPRGPWRYESPVIVLIGQRTMSSAESFALMLAQAPQVTTMGDRTAGSSANPRAVKLPAEIVVNLPRWLDMDPDGKPIDNVGVMPDVPIEAGPEVFTGTSDPVLDAALKRLRQQPTSERKPGKRE
jgi:carboxyl-terminal processing protease